MAGRQTLEFSQRGFTIFRRDDIGEVASVGSNAPRFVRVGTDTFNIRNGTITLTPRRSSSARG
jgi:hypothetical protein